jgi:hypothetical protein
MEELDIDYESRGQHVIANSGAEDATWREEQGCSFHAVGTWDTEAPQGITTHPTKCRVDHPHNKLSSIGLQAG